MNKTLTNYWIIEIWIWGKESMFSRQIMEGINSLYGEFLWWFLVWWLSVRASKRCCVHYNILGGNHVLLYHLFGKIVCIVCGLLNTQAYGRRYCLQVAVCCWRAYDGDLPKLLTGLGPRSTYIILWIYGNGTVWNTVKASCSELEQRPIWMTAACDNSSKYSTCSAPTSGPIRINFLQFGV